MYQITVTVDETLKSSLNEYTQVVGETIEDYLGRSLQWIGQVFDVRPLDLLSDEEVLEQSQLWMLPEQQDRLSDLLDRQREGLLTVTDRQELDHLMHLYKAGLLRKAKALAEAVQRGLIPALDQP